MTPHLRHPHDPSQTVRGIPADQVRRWKPKTRPAAATPARTASPATTRQPAPDDGNHPIGDATLIDTLRRIVAERQHAKINGVLINLWSAGVTVAVWDNLRDDKRQRLLRLRSHELILRCVHMRTSLTGRGDR